MRLDSRWSTTLLLLLISAWLTACGGAGSSVAVDKVAPTVSITDNLTVTTASGPVSLIFLFSEDIGNSFSADDIALSGGTAGSFTIVSGTRATLEVTPTVNAAGSIQVSVSAGKFTDLANNSNLLETSYARAFDTRIASNDWVLNWSDEFNGNALDMTVWSYYVGASGWGNNESQYYQAQNAVVKDGFLTITAKQEAVGGAPYTSARLQTSRKKTFTYGRFEMRAKLPGTQGMWPAFWLLGETCNSFGLYGGSVNWPACGEIDAMEMIGGLNDGSGDFTTHGTLHYLNAAGINPAPSFAYRNATRLSADFHTYTIDWTPQSFTWYIDGIPYGTKVLTADMGIFQKPFFLMLNLAVGGNWGGWPNASTVFPQTYVIDYLRHYTKTYPAANPVVGTAAGLPSVFHLNNDPLLNVAAGKLSGYQPLLTLANNTLSWYSPYLSGSYDAGVWSASFWTPPPSGLTSLRARIYRQSAAGSEVLLGEATLDPASTGSGNHISKFSFPGLPAVTLNGESIRLELTKLSGPALTLIVNGNDFDSRLDLPWSATGTVAGYPAAAATPFGP